MLRGVNKLTSQFLGFFFIRKHCPNERKKDLLVLRVYEVLALSCSLRISENQKSPLRKGFLLSQRESWQTWIEISYIPRDLITVIFYYQISLNPLKTQSLSQVSFPLLFPLCYIVPPVFTNSDKGKYKGKKTDNTL